jgi:hypothetical protein
VFGVQRVGALGKLVAVLAGDLPGRFKRDTGTADAKLSTLAGGRTRVPKESLPIRALDLQST